MKHFKIYTLFLILISNSSLACIQKLEPINNFDRYSDIFLGEVVAVNNIDYIKIRKKYLAKGKNIRKFSDITLPHSVTILVTHTIKGEVAVYNTKKVIISGCGVLIPKIYEEGLFFIEKRRKNKVIPVYKNESKYTKYLIKSFEVRKK